jgi:hypothetical protein
MYKKTEIFISAIIKMISEINKGFTHIVQQKMTLIYIHNFIMVYGKTIYVMVLAYIYGLKKELIQFLFQILIMPISKHLLENLPKDYLKKGPY